MVLSPPLLLLGMGHPSPWTVSYRLSLLLQPEKAERYSKEHRDIARRAWDTMGDTYRTGW